MHTSEFGLNLIKKHEGLRLKPYKCPAGLATVGWGHLIKPGENFDGGISQGEASRLLRKDVGIAETAIAKNVLVSLTQNQFDALVSLIFNIGTTAFQNSTLLRHINLSSSPPVEGSAKPGVVFNSGRYPTMESAWLCWNKANGQILSGLTLRRTDEWNLYCHTAA